MNIRDLHTKTYEYHSPFLILLQDGVSEKKKIEDISKILDTKISPDEKLQLLNKISEFRYCTTLLHLSVEKNHVEIAKFLLQSDADIEVAAKDGFTPLHYAAAYGFSDFIYLFYNYRAKLNLNIRDIDGNTPLHLAVINNQYECVRILLSLDKPADRSIKNKKRKLAIDLVGLIKSDDINKDKMANLFAQYENTVNRPPLHLAVKENNTKLVRHHLFLGAPVNQKDSDGNTALHYAAREELLYIIDKLCRQPDIDMNVTNNDGDTALHVLIKSKFPNAKCLERLMKEKIDSLIVNKDHLTAEDLIKNIKDKELRQALYQAFVNFETPEVTNIDDHSAVFTGLCKAFPHLELRNPNDFPRKNLPDIQEPVKQRSTAKRSSSSPRDRMTQEISHQDFSNKSTHIILSYLKHNGDPNKVTDKMTLIECAILRHNKIAFLELLRYGANIGENFFSDTLAGLDMLEFAEIEMTKDLNKLKAIIHNKIKREAELHDKAFARESAKLSNPESKTENQPPDRDDDRTKKCIKCIHDICSYPVNHHSLADEIHFAMLGFLSVYPPDKVYKCLLSQLDYFNESQLLISSMMVKEILLNSAESGYKLIDLTSYFAHFQNEELSRNLNHIAIYLSELYNATTYKSYLQVKRLKSCLQEQQIKNNIPKSSGKNSITDMIGGVLDSNYNYNLDEAAAIIAKELINLTAKSYHYYDLQQYVAKNSVNALIKNSILGGNLAPFFEFHILKQNFKKDPKKDPKEDCKKIMELLIRVAKICLTNHLIPDLNSTGAIVTALQQNNICRLDIQFDDKTSGIFNDLVRLMSPSDNYKYMRDFQSVYKAFLPWSVVLSKDSAPFSEVDISADNFQILGKSVYAPLSELKNRVDFYELQCVSDLSDRLRSPVWNKDEFEKMSLKIVPIKIRNLSSGIPVKKVKDSLNEQMRYKCQLSILYHSDIYTNEQALLYIRQWIRKKISRNSMTEAEGAALSQTCENYIGKSKSVNQLNDSSINYDSSSYNYIKLTRNAENTVSAEPMPYSESNTLFSSSESKSNSFSKKSSPENVKKISRIRSFR